MAKQKAKPQAAVAAKVKTKRSGYKRKSNKRVDVLFAQLSRLARKALNAAQYDKTLTFAQPVK